MIQTVEQIIWRPTKSDREKGRWLLDHNDITLPKDFKVAQSAFVGLKPNGWAADHRHKRQEILLALAGELYLIWRDSAGGRHDVKMLRDDGSLQAFLIAPNVAHLVENRSPTASGALYEWSDLIDEAVSLENNESLRLKA